MWRVLSPRLEALLPAEHRGRTDPLAQRARRLIWLATGLAPLHLGAAAISIALRGPNRLANILLVGGAGVALTPLVVRTVGAMPAAVWFLAVNLATVSAVAWVGYGPLSPAAQALVLFPVIGLVLGGPRLGVPFTGIAVAQIAALVLADRMGFPFPLEPSGPAFVLTHALVLAGVLGVVIGFLWAYDAAWREASARSTRAQAEVVAANEAKSTFLAHMSHELRTPLNAVIGYTELLLEDAGTERADLERIQGAGRHVLELVDQLLDLARIEAGRLQLQREFVDLDALTDTVLHEVRPLAEKQQATLIRAVDGPLTAHTDRLRVHQVLLNLLSNACKLTWPFRSPARALRATPPLRRRLLALGRPAEQDARGLAALPVPDGTGRFTERGTITLRAARVDGRIRVDVEDTGVGMSPEELGRVFEPFEQGAAGVNRGTGLGLAISRRLCEALGGSLTAESSVGVGTRFRMELPA